MKPRMLKNYDWKGQNSAGQKCAGRLLAMSEIEVREKLKAQRIQIRKLKSRRVSLISRIRNRLKPRDITLLTRQLATMLATGVPILQALKLVSDNHKKAEMKSLLRHVCQSIESGMPLAKSLHQASSLFDPLYIDLVATGEQSGQLDAIFERLALYREKSEQLRAKVIKASIYPSIVVIIAMLVSYLMLVLVIPQFKTMFASYGAELPFFTRQVLVLSDWVQQYGAWVMSVSAIGGLLLLKAKQRSSHLTYLLARLSLRLPILGSILTKAAIARFSRTLATSFSSGIPILMGLQTTGKTAGNAYFEQAVKQIHRDTAAGVPMYIAMRNTEAFPEMVLQMVMIGEESGQLDSMLNKIAAIYEFEVDNTVDNLSKILEPLIIVFLGVVVGGLVTAMYLPIFNLMSVMG
ncbi:type II secretion system F family protein [Vibrio sp. SM6]|uniref:Type II secretion system F family protein n=1 Tax=Vibrio agarilyticus TaxID=2726741 RepID=A0A7X8TQC2_9VIBR|nr:type II secretion system F family protein [Vibrio agarilyticus]NLS12794.1 type II secretion system F family protein [Vibrio agarilyticus]